ncbi:hypothetical protein C8R45DRAFT_946310 [Mycena sanguinolenta]|nr:hypothetical protein C8R45DRAFT_946310 [Mycena sanguinolenta]
MILSQVRRLAVIWIDFSDRAHVSISWTISQATNTTYVFRSHFFMDTGVLGFCTRSQIVFWRLDPNVTYPFHPNQKELLETANMLSRSVRTHAVPPEYGIYGVTCTDLGAQILSVIHFWPAHRSSEHGMLEIGPGCVYGHPHRILQTVVGQTGRYVLIRALPPEENPSEYLGLLHFCRTSSQDSPTITFRKLDIGKTSLDSCCDIALDDSLGLVLVLDDDGRMRAISYV